MSDRVRNVLLGVGLGIAPLLLLDLARQLGRAAVGEPDSSTQWWSLAAFVLVGVVAAVAVAMGRRDRAAPAAGAVVLALAVLPGLPAAVFARLPTLPVVTEVARELTPAVLVLLGAYAYAAVRGGRA